LSAEEEVPRSDRAHNISRRSGWRTRRRILVDYDEGPDRLLVAKEGQTKAVFESPKEEIDPGLVAGVRVSGKPPDIF